MKASDGVLGSLCLSRARKRTFVRFDGCRRSSSAGFEEVRPALRRSGLGEGRGRGAGLNRAGRVLVLPAVHAATAGVHEEVADGGELQAQLLRDGHLHLFAGTLVLFEDCDERPPLQVREDQTLFLGYHVSVFVLLLFLSLAGCHGKTEQKEIVK